MNMDLEMADIARNAAEATACILVTAYTMEQMGGEVIILIQAEVPMEQAEKYGSFISSLLLWDMGLMSCWEPSY